MLGKMDCTGLTHAGLVRPNNEDQFLIASLSKAIQFHSTSLNLDEHTRLFGASQGRLLLVADGMGGHAAGGRASALAVDSLVQYLLNTMHWFFRLREDSEEHFLDDLKAALGYAQDRIRAEGERLPGRHGMGTTLTLAYLVWPRMFVVHAGDSRCYLFRGGRLRQLTHDHTVAQQLVDRGVLDDASESRWSHVLWNVVGGGTGALHPEVSRAELALGDTLLLCTDGLTKHVGDAAIARILAEGIPSAEACQRLVDAANAAGGTDNVTVVVAHFRDARQQHQVAEAAAAQSLPAPPPTTKAVAGEPAAVAGEPAAVAGVVAAG